MSQFYSKKVIKDVADEILSQLSMVYEGQTGVVLIVGGERQIMSDVFLSWGAHDTQYGEDEDHNIFLRFSVNGMKFTGDVLITLTPWDDYNVKFINNEEEVVKELHQIYCDEIQNVIDEFVEKQVDYAH